MLWSGALCKHSHQQSQGQYSKAFSIGFLQLISYNLGKQLVVIKALPIFSKSPIADAVNVESLRN